MMREDEFYEFLVNLGFANGRTDRFLSPLATNYEKYNDYFIYKYSARNIEVNWFFNRRTKSSNVEIIFYKMPKDPSEEARKIVLKNLRLEKAKEILLAILGLSKPITINYSGNELRIP